MVPPDASPWPAATTASRMRRRKGRVAPQVPATTVAGWPARMQTAGTQWRPRPCLLAATPLPWCPPPSGRCGSLRARRKPLRMQAASRRSTRPFSAASFQASQAPRPQQVCKVANASMRRRAERISFRIYRTTGPSSGQPTRAMAWAAAGAFAGTWGFPRANVYIEERHHAPGAAGLSVREQRHGGSQQASGRQIQATRNIVYYIRRITEI